MCSILARNPLIAASSTQWAVAKGGSQGDPSLGSRDQHAFGQVQCPIVECQCPMGNDIAGRPFPEGGCELSRGSLRNADDAQKVGQPKMLGGKGQGCSFKVVALTATKRATSSDSTRLVHTILPYTLTAVLSPGARAHLGWRSRCVWLDRPIWLPVAWLLRFPEIGAGFWSKDRALGLRCYLQSLVRCPAPTPHQHALRLFLFDRRFRDVGFKARPKP
jgi:hypothetical protein